MYKVCLWRFPVNRWRTDGVLVGPIDRKSHVTPDIDPILKLSSFDETPYLLFLHLYRNKVQISPTCFRDWPWNVTHACSMNRCQAARVFCSCLSAGWFWISDRIPPKKMELRLSTLLLIGALSGYLCFWIKLKRIRDLLRGIRTPASKRLISRTVIREYLY